MIPDETGAGSADATTARPTGGADSAVTTGVTGSAWRASITPWGAIDPWDDGRRLEWYVAADDRWHTPSTEPTVRQRRVDGTAVTETRVRVPNGDIVQRISSVPDDGGITIVEVENESTMPVAVAFDRSDVLTERPIADIPIEGIELPIGSFVLPLGHRATLRIGVPHGAGRQGALRPELPSARSVANGWLATTERASRFVLPDGALGTALAERVVAERCELALGRIPTAADDPAGFAVALGELVRMGERPDPWLPELVEAVAAVGPRPGWRGDAALAAAATVLAAAGEDRATRDLGRIRSGRPASRRPDDTPGDLFVIPWLEELFARGADLLPDGIPTVWRGQSFEVYTVPTLEGSSVSFAIRWHGTRPAVLWEQTGTAWPLRAPVTAPEWATSEPSGEALWPEPRVAEAPDPDGHSFT